MVSETEANLSLAFGTSLSVGSCHPSIDLAIFWRFRAYHNRQTDRQTDVNAQEMNVTAGVTSYQFPHSLPFSLQLRLAIAEPSLNSYTISDFSLLIFP